MQPVSLGNSNRFGFGFIVDPPHLFALKHKGPLPSEGEGVLSHSGRPSMIVVNANAGSQKSDSVTSFARELEPVRVRILCRSPSPLCAQAQRSSPSEGRGSPVAPWTALVNGNNGFLLCLNLYRHAVVGVLDV